MKLYAIHLFLILLFVLILGCCSFSNTPLFESFQSTTITGPSGNSATVSGSVDTKKVVTGPQGNKALVTNTSNNSSSSSTITGPQGNSATISRSQIPPGDEDLYVLKSTIVPPVCPACPTTAVCEREKPCPACPPCARCPEPAFECKKVPSYTSNNDRYLPKPVLTDFSTFGS